MNLTTLNNQFHFNLPLDFIPPLIEERYLKYLSGKRKLHRSVLDYINSTIQTVSMPGVKFPVVSNPQNLHRKKIKWKTVGNIYDHFDEEVTVTFLNVDSNLNHMIMMDSLVNHYLDTDKTYDEPIVVTVLDERRNALYHVQYRDVMWTGLDGNTFGFNDQSFQNKTFTATFQYNFIDIEYVLDKTDIISNNTYGNLSTP
jgi:hypothetical protein